MKGTVVNIIILILSLNSLGQVPQATSEFQNEYPTSCEQNTFSLDVVVNRFLKNEITADYVIIISRLGNSESSATNLHKRRLYTVKTYLMNKTGHQLRVVTAKGDSKSGKGSIEIYIKGMVEATLVPEFCQDIPVAICDDRDADPQFYLMGKIKRTCR